LLKDPFRGAMVTTSVAWPPRCAVKLADADAMEKSGGEPVPLKVAVTNTSEVVRVTLHEPIPVQFVLQPENWDPEAGEAARLTVVPGVKLVAQDVPQLMPVGLLVTVPLPLPSSTTDRVCEVGMAPPSITVTLLLPVFAT
jgi:hypothetical protein